MGGTVPLSEHEQRQLEQIEQALYAEHPRLARAMRAKDPKVHYRRRVIEAAIGFVLGVGMVVAGVVLKANWHSWLAVAGFVVLLVSSIWAIASYRRMAGMLTDRTRRRRGRKSASRAAPSSGLMERIEERWRRRQEGNNR
jgi:hypothetical protein